MLTAILFPGQGSQTPDVREQIERTRPDLLAAVIEAVGEDPFPRVEDSTRFAQPAILCTALVAYSQAGIEPDLLAGHSLGEIGALAAAGALSEEDALRLVAERGRLMDEAGERAGGNGSMIALLGQGAAEHAGEIARDSGLSVANDNSPKQVVLSGDRACFETATELAGRLSLRAVELPVSGAFHSPMMASATPAFRAAVEAIEVHAPRVPVISGVTTRPVEDVRAVIVDALERPVRWRETLLALHELGARSFLETGPGSVLTGLVRRTLTDVETATMEQLATAHA